MAPMSIRTRRNPCAAFNGGAGLGRSADTSPATASCGRSPEMHGDAHLDTQAARDMAQMNAFIRSIAWHTLVPSGLTACVTW